MKFRKNQQVASVATGKEYTVVRDTPEGSEFVEVYALAFAGSTPKMVTTLAPVGAVVAVKN